MPSKKKKYNARFPSGRIKKIMQSDEEIGKVAQAVPVIISRTLELFVRSLLTKTLKITNSRSAKTLSTSHMKQCIMSEHRFDFLRELVKNIPDISIAEEANFNEDDVRSSPDDQYPDSDTPFDLSLPSTSNKASLAANESEPSNANTESNRSSMKRQCETNSVTVPASASKTRNDASSSKLPRLDSASQLQLANSTQRHRTKSHTIQSQTNTTRQHNSQQQLEQIKATKTLKQPQSDLPSPIVNFDFCNKPIVEINYSNLAITTKVPHDPLSAPANLLNATDDKVFNFNPDAIINIDLSNIIPSTTPTISSTDAAVSKNQKDALTVAPPNSRNSTYTINNTTCFELDEDYDNI